MRATWLADVLRATGLNVVEQPGWELRGRGDFIQIDGVMAHHTASPKTSSLATNLHVVINGNSVAPGPIANVLLWRDGTCHIIAAGYCNHAGKGVLPWLPVDGGNRRLISIEAVNDGIGEVWAPEMVIAYEIATAAILRHLGLSSQRATTHAEYAPTRKIDPAGPTGGRIATLPGRSTWSPVAWRERISDWLRPVPVPDPVPPPPIEVPPPLEDPTMLVVVDNKDLRGTPAELHRWVWNGVGVHRLANEDEFNVLKLLFTFHPNYAALATPFGMTTAEIASYS